VATSTAAMQAAAAAWPKWTVPSHSLQPVEQSYLPYHYIAQERKCSSRYYEAHPSARWVGTVCDGVRGTRPSWFFANHGRPCIARVRTWRTERLHEVHAKWSGCPPSFPVTLTWAHPRALPKYTTYFYSCLRWCAGRDKEPQESTER